MRQKSHYWYKLFDIILARYCDSVNHESTMYTSTKGITNIRSGNIVTGIDSLLTIDINITNTSVTTKSAAIKYSITRPFFKIDFVFFDDMR